MLHLLDTPHWTSAQSQWDLPHTLPGWTVAFLGVQRQWVSREHLCTLLWPDATASHAQHNLRVNLYRVRALLESWGIEASLQVERKRVRLQVATDLDELQRLLIPARNAEPPGRDPGSERADDRATELAGQRPALLPEMVFPGFPALAEWAELERAALQRAWRDAALTQLSGDRLGATAALVLCQAMMAVDPLDDVALSHQLQRLATLGRTSEARRLFDQYRGRLRQQLGLEPPLALDALAANLGGAAAVLAPPARDAFIGRELELSQLESMLGAAGRSEGVSGDGRVVTLLGPGGVGKSRIARELATRLAGRWRDGVAWVALADLGSAAQALHGLAEQIGLQPDSRRDVQPQVCAALSRRSALIVLDNAEHLSDLAPLLSVLQQASPSSTWLVTSRSPLALPMARSYMLEGLRSPDSDDAPVSAEQAMRFDGLRLLVSRVRALKPDFDISAHWAPCLELLRATSGWPLAIELAASDVAQHGVATVLAELALAIDALAASRAPPQARHDSMRASLALSWRLLEAKEQKALTWLSVFRGGFTRHAALAGCPSVVLLRLLERALVQVLGNGRFDLHPLVRQFAAEQLAQDAAQRAAAMRTHAKHFAARLMSCAAAEPDARPALLLEISADFDNFRAAWAALIDLGDVASIASAAPAWAEFGTARGRARELTQLIAAAMPATVAHTTARTALLQAAATLHFRAGDLDNAQALARDALAAADASGDAVGQRAMLNLLALTLKDLGRYDEAEQYAMPALQRCRAAGVEREIAAQANTCAILAKLRGDLAGAAALYAEGIAIHRRSANHRSLAICLNNLGNVHRARGDMVAAQGCFEESLRIAEQHGIASTRAFALVNLAIVHQVGQRAELALSYAQRAAAEPAAELGVLLAFDVVCTLLAIEQRAFGRAHEALRSLARRARNAGLHAAMLEAVNCHAKLLAALGQRDAAMARLVFLIDHPQLPATERGEARQALASMAPAADEQVRAQALANRFELELLVQAAVDAE